VDFGHIRLHLGLRQTFRRDIRDHVAFFVAASESQPKYDYVRNKKNSHFTLEGLKFCMSAEFLNLRAILL